MNDFKYVVYTLICGLFFFATAFPGYSQEGPVFVQVKDASVLAFQSGARLNLHESGYFNEVPQSFFGYDYLQVRAGSNEITIQATQNTHFYTLGTMGAIKGLSGGKVVGNCINQDGTGKKMVISRYPISANQQIHLTLSASLRTILAPTILLNAAPQLLELKGGIIDLDTFLQGKQIFLKDKTLTIPQRMPSFLSQLKFAKSLSERLQVDSIRSFVPIDYYIATRQKGLKGMVDNFVADADTFYVYQYKHSGSGRWTALPEQAKKGGILLAPNILIRDVEHVFGMPLATTTNAKLNTITDPAIEILPNGVYIAACKSKFDGKNTMVRIFRSANKGDTWEYVTELPQVGFFNFFTLNKSLYLMGTKGGFNQLIILKSDDEGKNWTSPLDSKTGLLRSAKSYHSASVSTVIHDGRIWRAFEDNIPKGKRFFRAFMMSAPIHSNLLDSASWTLSEPLPYDTRWISDTVDFKGWFEGNAVVAPDGHVVDILRVETWKYREMAAVIHYDKAGVKATFDPKKDLIDFPGGEKKFTIKYDSVSRKYWSIANCIFKEDHGKEHAGLLRNRLVLSFSDDLYHWKVKDTLISHPDPHFHGYQYPDWRIDGSDIVMVSRTASSTKGGLPIRQHDANYFTFHRVSNFRD